MTRTTPAPVLHRDDPDKAPLTGNVKVTRDDWLNAALDVLLSDGVEQVKVLTLATRLGVSRSSFYWYFKSRRDLLETLLRHWQETNTAAVVAQAEAPAATVTEAVCNVFRCVVDERMFNNPLDFAVRDWARRDANVRRLLDASDAARLTALTGMFARFGYAGEEAMIRARVLYFMQVGYDLADLGESTQHRLTMVPMYLYCFTGQQPRPQEIETFTAYALSAKEAKSQ